MTGVTRWVVVLLGVGAAASLRPAIMPAPQNRLIRAAAAALAREDFPNAARLAELALRDDPHSKVALAIAGRAAMGSGQSFSAIKYLEGADDSDTDPLNVWIWLGLADRLMAVGQVGDAERVWRRVLDAAPDDVEAHSRLSSLLVIEGRNWEALPHLLATIRSGKFELQHLKHAASTDQAFVAEAEFRDSCAETVPCDPLPVVGGLALSAFLRNDHENAIELFRSIVEADPNQFEAHGRLGQVLVVADHDTQFLDWHAQLPSDADTHPEVWYARGLWAQTHGQLPAAVRCFGECIRRHPNHARANYRMSRMLATIGKAAAAKPFAERAAKLAEIEAVLPEVSNGLQYVQMTAELMESLGRFWEAAAWYELVWHADPHVDWATNGLARVRSELFANPDQLTPNSMNPAWKLELDAYPLPDLQRLDKRSQPTTLAPSRIAFRDDAQRLGLNFRYHNAPNRDAGVAHIFDFSGGGVAVLDYDQDGWSDVYLTQSAPWPEQSEQQASRDRLFRNIDGKRFEDVTDQAGLQETRFSFGATVGDFNDDGWPDLYVANLGQNSLFVNNADGSFTEVPDAGGAAGQEWTSSCLMADLNGDSLPDIYAVNYLADAFDRQCFDERDRPVQCPPTLFQAEQDRLYLNLGNGRFQDVTESSGIVRDGGKGLGVVAAEFDGTGKLNVFVANDLMANTYLVNKSTNGKMKFIEAALDRGLAFGDDGQGQACMGIAVDDANGDGRLELFVTNFFAEANNYFTQLEPGLFTDDIGRANLRTPGFQMMGWGTQFLDADLDGRPDLVVANGHLDDFSFKQIPYRMPAQFFQNVGSNRFTQHESKTLGAYFKSKHLGRAVALIDWNRDGREDFCVTHVNEPVSLLTNESPNTGNSLVVRLRGTESGRDAIGASIRVVTELRTRTLQLTAGSGFMASNHQQFIIGLGQAEVISELAITWPTGKIQTFHGIRANQELIIIEGTSKPFTVSTPPQ